MLTKHFLCIYFIPISVKSNTYGHVDLVFLIMNEAFRGCNYNMQDIMYVTKYFKMKQQCRIKTHNTKYLHIY